MKRLILILILFAAGCSSKGDIQIGMSQQEVMKTLGEPYYVDRSQFEWGILERWQYLSIVPFINWTDGIKPDYHFVYFENGKVDSFHN